MTRYKEEKKEACLTGIWELARFLETHPELCPREHSMTIGCYGEPTELTEVLRALATGTTPDNPLVKHGGNMTDTDESVYFTRQFGPQVTFYVWTNRETMGCKKVQRTKTITTEEWQCGPLLEELNIREEGK